MYKKGAQLVVKIKLLTTDQLWRNNSIWVVVIKWSLNEVVIQYSKIRVF